MTRERTLSPWCIHADKYKSIYEQIWISVQFRMNGMTDSLKCLSEYSVRFFQFYQMQQTPSAIFMTYIYSSLCHVYVSSMRPNLNLTVVGIDVRQINLETLVDIRIQDDLQKYHQFLSDFQQALVIGYKIPIETGSLSIPLKIAVIFFKTLTRINPYFSQRCK